MGAKQFLVRDETTGSTGYIESEQAGLALSVVSDSDLGALFPAVSTANTAAANTAAVRAAVTTLTAADGGLLIFPHGEFLFDLADGSPLITVPVDTPIHIRGAGCGNVNTLGSGQVGTRLRRSAGTGELVKGTGTGINGNQRIHVTARDIEFHGGSTAGDVVRISRPNEMDFYSVRLTAATGRLMWLSQAWNNMFTNCFFVNGGNGTTAPAVLIDAIAGEGVNGASNVNHFTGCEWEGNTGTDVRLDGSVADGSPCTATYFEGCKAERQLASKTYPVFDLPYANQTFWNGGGLNAGGTGTTSRIVQIGTNNGANNIATFTGMEMRQLGTPDYFIDQVAGRLILSAVNFQQSVNPTRYVRIGSGVSLTGFRAKGCMMSAPTLLAEDNRVGIQAAYDFRTLRLMPDDFEGQVVSIGPGRAYQFVNGVITRMWFVIPAPNDAVPGGSASLILSWGSPSAGGGTVQWRARYVTTFGAEDLSSAAVTTADAALAAAPATANGFTNTSIGIAAGGILTPTGMTVVELSRQVGGTLADVAHLRSILLTYATVDPR